jgi:hypothetical protein
MSLRPELTRTHDGDAVTDELLRILQRRIVGSDLHLRENRDDVSGVAGFAQRVLERLLQHVAYPTRSAGHQHSKRQWRDLASRFLVPHKLVPHLWSIAVNYNNSPAVENEIDNWPKALSRVSELIGNS